MHGKLSEQSLAHGSGQESCSHFEGKLLQTLSSFWFSWETNTHGWNPVSNGCWFKHWFLSPIAAVLFGRETAGHIGHSQGARVKVMVRLPYFVEAVSPSTLLRALSQERIHFMVYQCSVFGICLGHGIPGGFGRVKLAQYSRGVESAGPGVRLLTFIEQNPVLSDLHTLGH